MGKHQYKRVELGLFIRKDDVDHRVGSMNIDLTFNKEKVAELIGDQPHEMFNPLDEADEKWPPGSIRVEPLYEDDLELVERQDVSIVIKRLA